MNTQPVATKHAALKVLLEKALALVGLALIVFGAKMLFIRYFGSALPYWDQWDAEADSLYKAYLNSSLSWSALFAAHNEHRIFLTRVLSLALFELDGGWDPILQMMVNAALHVVAILLIVFALQRILRPAQLIALIVFTAVLFVLPIGWENLLAGFQSQFYLLLIFSIVALSGFAVAAVFSVRWWLSVACTAAAFFSMASGALIGAAALAIVAVQLLLRVRHGSKEYAGAAILFGMSTVMIAYVPHIVGHDGLKAHNIRELSTALLACLQYPRAGSWIALLTNLPLVAYAYFVVAARPARTSPHWVILSVVVWWFGQILSLSYGRAVAPNSSRYLDITIVAMPVNFAILLFFATLVRLTGKKWVVLLVTVGWLAMTFGGLMLDMVRTTYPNVIKKAAQSREQEANVAAYLRTGDITALQNKSMLAIPYPSADRLASLLSDPTIRMALPRTIRPEDMDEKALLERTVLRGRSHAALERTKLAIMNLAPVVLALGMALALGAGFSLRPAPLKDEGAD
ncbi:hypothetical protein FIU28_19065 [Tardiphaga sp. vice154]|uniref:hypothetical protein n=1 Tax=Tardiphaga sp. vice154 TaxID=2592814 RepID=UPI0011637B77|nr:hypothetical protein [Tardiphaga sp. vice154]QDM23020.1 hypothetical protein FIU28_19065 [Tardiphaga sp. vice154]